MRNSKDKGTPGSQNRLAKTQVQKPQPGGMDNTYYGRKNPETQKVPSGGRNGSTQKIDYKVEEHMTVSNIHQAKQGLQLLKKKMSRNGMSREKVERKEEFSETVYQRKQQPSRTANQTVHQERNVRQPTPGMEKKTSEIPRKPPVSSKTISNTEDRPVRKPAPPPPPPSDYVNPAEEAPLNSNQDFMAILEREMAKQNAQGPPPAAKKPAYNAPPSMPAEDEAVELVQCSKGCGRQFGVQAIEKHEKICEKVFQSKRKAFNSAAHRQADQDFKAPPPVPGKVERKPEKKKEEKVPKWKQQSAQFRAGIKLGRGQQLSAEEKQVMDEGNSMTQCQFCGRKFNEDAAKRHIPICERKAKQMPANNKKPVAKKR